MQTQKLLVGHKDFYKKKIINSVNNTFRKTKISAKVNTTLENASGNLRRKMNLEALKIFLIANIFSKSEAGKIAMTEPYDYHLYQLLQDPTLIKEIDNSIVTSFSRKLVEKVYKVAHERYLQITKYLEFALKQHNRISKMPFKIFYAAAGAGGFLIDFASKNENVEVYISDINQDANNDAKKYYSALKSKKKFLGKVYIANKSINMFDRRQMYDFYGMRKANIFIVVGVYEYYEMAYRDGVNVKEGVFDKERIKKSLNIIKGLSKELVFTWMNISHPKIAFAKQLGLVAVEKAPNCLSPESILLNFNEIGFSIKTVQNRNKQQPQYIIKF